MTEQKMLIGSLSNDLQRVAVLTQRGSSTAALRFMHETAHWTTPLLKHQFKKYINKIILEVHNQRDHVLSIEKAEQLLMYSVLLQNYTLKME